MAHPRLKLFAPLIALALLLIALLGSVAAGTKWSNASWAPRLALDLAGGTQIVLTPQVSGGAQVTDNQINEAIRIIRQRVDSSGVAEAEITRQGANNIVVSLPGDPREQAEAIRLVSQSAQMSFRPVLDVQAGAPAPVEPGAPGATSAPTAGATPGATASPSAAATGTPAPAASPTDSANPRAIPKALTVDAPAATTPSPEPTSVVPGQAGRTTPKYADGASDLGQVTEDIAAQYMALDCSDPANLRGGTTSDPNAPLATCSQDGTAKYLLGPVELRGDQLQTASSGLGRDQRGNPTGQWVVNLEMKSSARAQYEEITKRIVQLEQPRNQMAVVLDDLVVVAPTQNAAITDGKAEISGNFTNEEAGTLASQLRFGALPTTFRVETQEQISALLGSEQLRGGLIAGGIGLALVALYSLMTYRALGFVTIASLVVAGAFAYGLVLLLGWTQGFRLSLPGVAGMIIAIGVTADSFIVYFERIRDEVRDGRSLTSAVERAWSRARRTIIVSDIINLLAAVVLYFLAVGGVRGFAFTLGLTTIIDLLVVMLFTHPVMRFLARTKFFGQGHPLSGFGEAQLGRAPAYVGRGRIRTSAEGPAAGHEVGELVDGESGTDEEDSASPPRRRSYVVDDEPGQLTIAERKAAAAARARRAQQSGSAASGSTMVDDATRPTSEES